MKDLDNVLSLPLASSGVRHKAGDSHTSHQCPSARDPGSSPIPGLLLTHSQITGFQPLPGEDLNGSKLWSVDWERLGKTNFFFGFKN